MDQIKVDRELNSFLEDKLGKSPVYSEKQNKIEKIIQDLSY